MCWGEQEHVFELPYDILVVGVGAVNNTFNTPGVMENCFFLKVGGRPCLVYSGQALANVCLLHCSRS
jgi:hypothetical protein